MPLCCASSLARSIGGAWPETLPGSRSGRRSDFEPRNASENIARAGGRRRAPRPAFRAGLDHIVSRTDPEKLGRTPPNHLPRPDCRGGGPLRLELTRTALRAHEPLLAQRVAGHNRFIDLLEVLCLLVPQLIACCATSHHTFVAVNILRPFVRPQPCWVDSAFGTNRLETQSGEGAPCAILLLARKFVI